MVLSSAAHFFSTSIHALKERKENTLYMQKGNFSSVYWI
jgi:hypothetical protein